MRAWLDGKGVTLNPASKASRPVPKRAHVIDIELNPIVEDTQAAEAAARVFGK